MNRLFNKRLLSSCAAACLQLSTGTAASYAATSLPAGAPVHHVLLVSIDGLHAIDLARFVAGHPDSTLAHLAHQGINYSNAHTVSPADSFPGLLALVTGGTPAVTGVYYDETYDRALSAAGSDCGKTGTKVVYNEGVDLVGKSGKDVSIDPAKLPLDPQRGCTPVLPHSYLRVNTVFEVIRQAGGYTAWADKHPTYEIVNGPSGKGVDDLFVPEIGANFEGSHGGKGAEITGSLESTEAYDAFKARAVMNQIDGRTHDGHGSAPVPNIFGLNMQALNVAQKLSGYSNAEGVATPGVDAALAHCDELLGGFVAELSKAGLDDDTLIIVTAKHGNGPIDRTLLKKIDTAALKQTIEAAAPGSAAQLAVDHGALVWLRAPSKTAIVAAALEAHAAELGITDVLSGTRLALQFPSPLTDNRSPDIVILSDEGVIYAKPNAGKLVEHGGFHEDDTHVGLLVSNPRLKAMNRQVVFPVSTTQVAPTILGALGLSPASLQAVAQEGTPALPGVSWQNSSVAAQ